MIAQLTSLARLSAGGFWRCLVMGALGAMVIAGEVSAQQPTFRDPLLDRMEGEWILEGVIAGERTVHDVSADWVLNHQYMRLHEVSRSRTADGKPAYEALVYIGWDEPKGTYACVWLDNYGGVSTQSLGTAPKDSKKLAFMFVNRGGGATYNSMSYDAAAQKWSWQIREVKDGRSSLFADVTLRRAPARP